MKRMFFTTIFVFVFSVGFARIQNHSYPERYLAVKTNAITWAAAITNIAIEVQAAKRISVELPLLWSPWYSGNTYAVRMFGIQPEGRYWLGEMGKGHFIGLHVHLGWFNVKWKLNRYQDTNRPLLGGGIGYGYLQPFSRHWAGEFSVGAGYANMHYDTFYNIPNGARIDTRSLNYWGVTRINLSVIYRF